MYAFAHNGKAYGPSGIITDIDGVPLSAEDAPAFNAELERQEIALLKTFPERVVLYVKAPSVNLLRASMEPLELRWSIATWTGTVVASGSHVYVGQKREFSCFGPFPSTRRPVTARIFGTLYHGWYFESSGDYCRLKKAKRQSGGRECNTR